MEKRNPLLVMLFSLVTFNIYAIFWLYWTKKEMVKKGAKIPPFWFIFLPLIAIFGLISWIFITLAVGSTTVDGSRSVSGFLAGLSVVFGIAVLAGIVLGLYWIYKYCVAIAKVTKGKMAVWMSIGLLIGLYLVSNLVVYGGSIEHQVAGAIVGVVWFGIIQHYFNQVGPTKKKSSAKKKSA